MASQVKMSSHKGQNKESLSSNFKYVCLFNVKFLKEIVAHFGKYTYSQCWELDESSGNTFMSVH